MVFEDFQKDVKDDLRIFVVLSVTSVSSSKENYETEKL